MFLTIEVMNELKEKYIVEIRALEAKVSVVNDLIEMAGNKVPTKSEEEVKSPVEEEVATPEVQTAIY